MPTHCSVPGCTQREVGTRYFQVPDKRRREWLNALGLKHVSRYGKICSKHFRKKDLSPAPYYGSNRRGYKPEALPTRYPHLDSSPDRSSDVDLPDSPTDTSEHTFVSEKNSETYDAPRTDENVESAKARRAKLAKGKNIACVEAIKNHWRLVNYKRNGANVLEEYVDNR